jgi:complement component 1 Q subcomponent-binding protein
LFYSSRFILHLPDGNVSRVTFAQSNAKGSINVDTMCQEGAFVVDNISFYPDAQLGTELTAEADWKRRGLYIGPQFDTLDVTVQEEFEKFLQERGINENLAMLIPEYSEYKEQKVRGSLLLSPFCGS